MKRGFGVSATLLLGVALVLSGCGQSGNSDSKSTAGTKKPVTFTLFTSDATEDLIFDDPVAKAITEKTGVTLKIDHPVGGDTQAIPLMIASGEYPDLIYAKGDLTKLIDAGAVIPLDDLIAKKGKNLKKLYGDQIVRLKNSVADPKIYSVGTYDVNAGIWETDGTMQLQHAVLKELGYPKIQTLDDYEAALKAYIAKHPTIDGKKTIGLSLLIDTWQWYIDLSNPSGFITGHPDDGQWFIDDTTFEAQYKFLSPEVITYYKWLNKLNAEGLLDPESFTQKEDVWKAKIASGRVLGLAYPIWGYGDSRSSLINDGKEDRTYAYLPVAADASYASKVPSLKNYGFGGGWGIAISSKCKDPERAFEFLDWMCSEEAQVLINWGIKGVNYDVVNGKRVFKDSEQQRYDSDPDYKKKTGVEKYQYPFPQYGKGYIDSTGSYITRKSPENNIKNYRPVEKETLAAYGAKMWTDLFPTSESLGISKHGQAWQYTLNADTNAIVTEADNYMKNALANIVLGKPENFDKSWAKIQDDLKKMGIEKANAEMTRMVKEKVAMWSAK